MTVRICDYVTVTHPDNAPASMFILSSGSVIKGNNKKGRLRGNSANQSSIRRCISAVGVTGLVSMALIFAISTATARILKTAKIPSAEGQPYEISLVGR